MKSYHPGVWVEERPINTRSDQPCVMPVSGQDFNSRLINDQIKTVQRTNIVQARRFSEQPEEAINRYTNRALTTAEIISELMKLAKELRDNNDRHKQLGLGVSEAAFYYAIVQNDSAVMQMGDDVLEKFAVELIAVILSSATIDWSLKESVRATIRSKVRRLLAKYDYTPDREEKAVELVLQLAALLAGNGEGVES